LPRWTMPPAPCSPNKQAHFLFTQGPGPAPAQYQAVAGRDGLRDHQRYLRAGQPCPARSPPLRALGDRERPALHPRCHLRRGRLPHPDRHGPQ
jgi:hypothetical protein